MAKGIPDKTHEGGLHGSAAALSSNMARLAFAEMIGTFLLVLVGTAVASAAALGKNTAGPAYNSLAIALSFGLILMPIVASIGQISGAHVNPAVTIALAVVRKFPGRYVPAYIVAQMVGAIIASLVIWGAYGKTGYAVHLGAPAHGAAYLQVLLTEALIAFMLMFTIIAVATDPRVPAGSASLAIGFALAAGVLLGGPVSGGAGNPARALGPMIVAGTYPAWYVYIGGPIIGAVVAALLYLVVEKANAPKISVADRSTDRPATRPHERFTG